VTLSAASVIDDGPSGVDALVFADALEGLARVSPQGAQAVQMRFWAEMTFAQIASALQVSEREARDAFNFAKAWLRRALTSAEGPA
jgi:DNA-directed RNA polymerase specialized sigma24 family protein